MNICTGSLESSWVGWSRVWTMVPTRRTPNLTRTALTPSFVSLTFFSRVKGHSMVYCALQIINECPYIRFLVLCQLFLVFVCQDWFERDGLLQPHYWTPEAQHFIYYSFYSYIPHSSTIVSILILLISFPNADKICNRLAEGTMPPESSRPAARNSVGLEKRLLLCTQSTDM